jgi:hypothetical protein
MPNPRDQVAENASNAISIARQALRIGAKFQADTLAREVQYDHDDKVIKNDVRKLYIGDIRRSIIVNIRLARIRGALTSLRLNLNELKLQFDTTITPFLTVIGVKPTVMRTETTVRHATVFNNVTSCSDNKWYDLAATNIPTNKAFLNGTKSDEWDSTVIGSFCDKDDVTIDMIKAEGFPATYGTETWDVIIPDGYSGTIERIVYDLIHWPSVAVFVEEGWVVSGGYPAAAPTEVELSDLVSLVYTDKVQYTQTDVDEPDLSKYTEYQLKNHNAVVKEKIESFILDAALSVGEMGLGAALPEEITPSAVLKALDPGRAGTFFANENISEMVVNLQNAATQVITDSISAVTDPAEDLIYAQGQEVASVAAGTSLMVNGYSGTYVASEADLSVNDPLKDSWHSPPVAIGTQITQWASETSVYHYPTPGTEENFIWFEATSYVGSLDTHVDGSQPTMEGNMYVHIAKAVAATANLITVAGAPFLGWDGSSWRQYVLKASLDKWKFQS